MKEEGYGRIINIISTSVKQPIEGLGVSNTIRGAVASWSKTLAGELGPFGITVNNVLPGATSTDRLDQIMVNIGKKMNTSAEEAESFMKSIIPAKRFAQPEEIAYAVVFLSSAAAGYINGINLPVDGGRTKSL
jgi:3-oxoacyl-[acyl-carrier protein] reductase